MNGLIASRWKDIGLAFCMVLTALYISGCGAGGPLSVGSGGAAGATSSNKFTVKVADGIIRNATVSLYSLKTGQKITSVDTDPNRNGVYTVFVERTKLTGLDDDEILYFYAESKLGSSVMLRGGQERNLQAGQLKFKSFLPPGNVLKTLADTLSDLSQDTRVKKTSNVTHFSNAKSVIVEAKLKKDGVINGTIKPGQTGALSSAAMQAVIGQVNTVEAKLTDQNDPLTKKFVLVSMATKAIVEQGNAQIIENQTSTSLSDSDQILQELVENTGNLSTTFLNLAGQLKAEIDLDLQDATFQDNFDTAAITTITNGVSSQDALDVASSDVVILLPGVEATILNETAKVEVPDAYFFQNQTMSDSGLNFDLNPTHIPNITKVPCESNPNLCQ